MQLTKYTAKVIYLKHNSPVEVHLIIQGVQNFPIDNHMTRVGVPNIWFSALCSCKFLQKACMSQLAIIVKI